MARFVTITTFAKLSEVSLDAIYKRIKRGKLKYSDLCEMSAIDLHKYSPGKFKHNKIVGSTMPS